MICSSSSVVGRCIYIETQCKWFGTCWNSFCILLPVVNGDLGWCISQWSQSELSKPEDFVYKLCLPFHQNMMKKIPVRWPDASIISISAAYLNGWRGARHAQFVTRLAQQFNSVKIHCYGSTWMIGFQLKHAATAQWGLFAFFFPFLLKAGYVTVSCR